MGAKDEFSVREEEVTTKATDIEDLLAEIDSVLRDFSGAQIASTAEVTDRLLDVRQQAEKLREGA
jgi:hypothetical protein